MFVVPQQNPFDEPDQQAQALVVAVAGGEEFGDGDTGHFVGPDGVEDAQEHRRREAEGLAVIDGGEMGGVEDVAVDVDPDALRGECLSAQAVERGFRGEGEVVGGE